MVGYGINVKVPVLVFFGKVIMIQ